MHNKFLHDFYVKNVLWTKCCWFLIFGTFFGLDVLSNCKKMKKWENIFNSHLQVMCMHRSDNGWDRRWAADSNLAWKRNLISGWWIVWCVHTCLLYQDWHRQIHWEHRSKICGEQERLTFWKLYKSANGIRGVYKLVGNKKIPVRIPSRCSRKIYVSGVIQD